LHCILTSNSLMLTNLGRETQLLLSARNALLPAANPGPLRSVLNQCFCLNAATGDFSSTPTPPSIELCLPNRTPHALDKTIHPHTPAVFARPTPLPHPALSATPRARPLPHDAMRVPRTGMGRGRAGSMRQNRRLSLAPHWTSGKKHTKGLATMAPSRHGRQVLRGVFRATGLALPNPRRRPRCPVSTAQFRRARDVGAGKGDGRPK
jgi:hypothetical protein